MKIKLPHRILELTEEDKSLPCEEKVELVNSILQEKVSESLTLEMYLHESFDNPQSIVILDMLGYFISKIHKKRQDILTRESIKGMQSGDGRTTPFSSLSQSNKADLGIAEEEDYYGQ